MLIKCALFLFLIKFELYLTQNDDTQEELESVFRIDYEYLPDIKSHFKIHTLPRTKDEANVTCVLEGAELFFPNNIAEVIAVIKFWNTAQPFIRSAYVSLTKNEFKTTAVAGRQFLQWSEGEPNNAGGNEECLVLKKDGTLNDENCNSKYPFICKKPHKQAWNEECHIYDLDYKYSETIGRCYKFHLTPKSWMDAYTTCHREQSYLAVVDSDNEANHLLHLISNNTVVKSTTDVTVHLGFFNRNGWITRTGVPVHESYNKWGPSQPDGNVFEDCGAMTYDGFLHDVPCYKKSLFVCEHELPIKF